MFISALIQYVLSPGFLSARSDYFGMVIITDSIERLEGLTDKSDETTTEREWMEFVEKWGLFSVDRLLKEQVCLLKSGEPFSEQLKRQECRPIVLMSTQRYFMLNESIRDHLFYFKGKRGETIERTLVLFDEYPYFSKTAEIDHYKLGRIESALNMGLANDVEEKDFMTAGYDVFKRRLLDVMKDKEKKREKENLYLYWKDRYVNTITNNDELFFQVIEEHKASLISRYRNFMEDINTLKTIMKEGAILKSEKKGSKSRYNLSFHVIKDNRHCFYLGGNRKFFVFDGTADIDPRYNLDYIEFCKIKKADTPINLTVQTIRCNTSKINLAAMNRRMKLSAFTEAVCEYVKGQVEKDDKVLIVTYQPNTGWYRDQFPKEDIRYFGNLKGFNYYRDYCYLAHIGLNRFPDLEYLFRYFACHYDEYEKLAQMTEEETIAYFDAALRRETADNKVRKAIDDIGQRTILCDFEQNIFRLKIRDITNTDPVMVFVLYDYQDQFFTGLRELMEARFKPYGVRFEYLKSLPGLSLKKTMSRKARNEDGPTNCQKVITFLEKMKRTKTQFMSGDISKTTGLTIKQIQKTKKNKDVKALFREAATGKNGVYCFS